MENRMESDLHFPISLFHFPTIKPMNKLKIILFIGTIALLGAGCGQAPEPAPEPELSPALKTAAEALSPPQKPSEKITEYSILEISKHKSPEDCWLLIEGRVYDVTDFDASHPGGKAILEGCGKNATMLFETRPMGSGTPHSDSARDLMEDYEIGTLKL